MANEKPTAGEEIQVKLNLRIPPRMPSVYAHHMFIQPGENEIILSFFEIIPPLVLPGEAEERLKHIQETGVVAECVARITVAIDKLPIFANAMQQFAGQMIASQKQDADTAKDSTEN